MARMRLTTECCRNWLNWMIGAATSAGGVRWALYKNTFDPGCDDGLAEFLANKCAFDGYADVVVGNSAANDYGLCGARVPLGAAMFNYVPAGEPHTTDTAGGAFLMTFFSEALIAWVPFDEDFTFDDDNDVLHVHYDLCLVDGCGAA